MSPPLPPFDPPVAVMEALAAVALASLALPLKVRSPSARSPVTAAPLTVMLLSPALAPLPNPIAPPTASATVPGLIISVASAAVESSSKSKMPCNPSWPLSVPPFAMSVA
ncbi:MAG: hypothetical protein DME59_07435 [Verrucomicrobia bacterium]|nr:MAG: hypothetical protein DME59_07435 [Verrucomicrobiota bacterium]